MPRDMARTWARIKTHAGQEFHQKTGASFRYHIDGVYVVPDRTNQRLPRKHVEKALSRMPVDGPGQLNDLRGPSYLYALLVDSRIRQDDW